MKVSSQSITAVANLILAAAVSYYVLKPSTDGNQAAMASELEALNKSVNQLTVTLQGYSTSAAQLDYLNNKIENLERLDRSIRNRIQVVKAEEMKSPTADGEKRIKQLGEAQTKVQNQLKKQRGAMVKIITGLERKLHSSRAAQRAAKTTTEQIPSLEEQDPVDIDVEEQEVAE